MAWLSMNNILAAVVAKQGCEMANKDPSRTEQATAKRIQEERNKGTVLSSQDVNSTVVIFGGTLLLLATVPYLVDGFADAMRRVLAVDCRAAWDTRNFTNGAMAAVAILAKHCLPFMLGACLLGALTMRLQVGKFWSIKPLKWKFDSFKLQGYKQLLPNKQNIVKLLLTVAKLSIIGYLIYLTIRADYDDILGLPFMTVPAAARWMAWRFFWLVIKVVVLFVVIAAIDYYFKHKKYYDDLMMTKQEVKDERKNAEGDPMVKAKIRGKMRELFFRRMMNSVSKADVVITNPTHVAVALKYNVGSYAPVVVAKGLRKRALKIKELAIKNNVPIIEAPPLARSLYRKSTVGGFIPEELFGAVAALLANLHRSGKRKFDMLAKAG